MHPTKRTCPGCGRHFLPGGYTNHLKLTRDPRCKSVRNSVFQPPSNTPFYHSAIVPTPGPSHAPSHPIPGPSNIPDNLNLDVEMADFSGGSQDLPPVDSNTNLPLPGQPTGANGHGADRQDIPNELLNTCPHYLSSGPLAIHLDTDSDSSDGEDDGHILHDQEPISPPGRLFWPFALSGLR